MRRRSNSALALQAWRSSLSLTHAQAGARLGVSRGRVSQYVVGLRSPERKVAGDIERLTGGLVTIEGWDIYPESEAGSSVG